MSSKVVPLQVCRPNPTVSAIRVTKENLQSAADWCDGYLNTEGTFVVLNDGFSVAHPGQFIVESSSKDRYFVHDDEQFRAHYIDANGRTIREIPKRRSTSHVNHKTKTEQSEEVIFLSNVMKAASAMAEVKRHTKLFVYEISNKNVDREESLKKLDRYLEELQALGLTMKHTIPKSLLETQQKGVSV